MLKVSCNANQKKCSAYELYIATTTSTTTRTSEQMVDSTFAAHSAQAEPVILGQQTESDKFGDEEMRMPGGYYGERQTSSTDNQTRSSWGMSKRSKINKDLAQSEALCARFKATLSRKDVKVHFVGAW
jgi:hypothetical protein